VGQGVTDGNTFALRVGDGSGQELPGQLIPAFRQGDGKLSRRATVELGGPAGPGAPAAGGTPELDLEQAVVDELVEVKLGDVAGYSGTLGSLVATDWAGLGDDEAVEGAPQGLP
jgi:hypothetical protein